MIEVKDLNKTFKVSKREKGFGGMMANLIHPKYEYKQAVKDMNFTINEGEMVGFIGPNGAPRKVQLFS